MKRKLIFIFALLVLLISGCATEPQVESQPYPSSTDAMPSTRVVIDMTGKEVEVPYVVDAYVESWAAHTTIDMLLDNLDGLVASNVPSASRTESWIHMISDNINTAKSLEFSDNMNLEEIIAVKPDVVFGNVESYREMFTNIGIPYVNVSFDSYDTMIQSIRLTAEILGTDAQENAEKYIDYLNSRIEWVGERVSVLNDDEKLSVVHGYPMYTLRIDGANTIIDEWINFAGAINAAESVDGAKKTISLEQLMIWDPDVIITGTGWSDAEDVINDPAWANLTAVKNGMVFVNPKGIFMWDRYGTESALQVQWCASVLYPELFADFDIREEVKLFYREFMRYELTDEQVDKFMNHENP